MKKIYIFFASIILSLSISLPVFSKSLSVPFTIQAPEQNWSQPWQDACEETTIAMVDFFYAKNTFTTESAKTEILKIINIKNKFIGESLDENAKTILTLINNFLPWEAHIKANPTLEELKYEIDNDRPIILPVHGRYLYNPFFKNGGPDYHTLVISGYDDSTKEFITQEPGTRYGLDFRYSYDTIMNAIHDFLPDQKTMNGDKLTIFTNPSISNSAHIDADADGLTKIEEIQQKTLPWSKDSDNDGYEDGKEISMGYSPIAKTTEKILLGTLIKSPESPMVYLFHNGIRRHILNETVFINHGWKWFDIFTVPSSFVENLQLGEEIVQ
ncbi:MAG: hypothetical protein A2725_03890 [Candidatus Magasanikbacteria bacterium RIFCSPHIGHO2_01_FULL_33_34]|uniref:Peptidase C39-like domain-containing protein n=1 Tax=Candidatus Magasanikbacteria bacterium RIFCSPHIGHO2_01_FULL_33_34 TaxID=1798671 RepID=A0A1F6LHH3_9BACT|nr:MAG: hypothetical protein A2725_03890 [Candidatus Magasanikbacteria bacterium RIFCSPHIGHO2_01_FULL_33_34]OGH65110.1 MAG: hypothetical protein A3B83_03650 [Candidatus Magasanikbacteria bacterium RIFCSPHIGHO2_02_FULL_33_17]OGH75346.1 MAG: hypothetical protein A3A89_04515 [Candidatus Magasanikbacteria bacterium RIFCSPLOWO2_01_FULL_33_34]OGH81271.1 MAG: hypothetical protein A3F93_04575 [Candidatus Magasanikbacteria bacterium RIFCSPLOWO2_12_FULL_34_7]